MKLIIDIPKEHYRTLQGAIKNHKESLVGKIILNGTHIPILDNATPCDFCRYNPPSSTDGKPCCMCPATGRSK